MKQGSRSRSQNVAKKSKMHHFLEIVQYTSNPPFLNQNLMGNPKKKKKLKNAYIQVPALLHTFFCEHV